MTWTVQELDYQKTPFGDLLLRVRASPSLGGAHVYEMKLNDEFLMSSAVNQSERALAQLALQSLQGKGWDVLIGGLGLGYTAAAALEFESVRKLDIVELLGPVVGWHRDGLLPVSHTLCNDPRCSLIEGDFFEHVGPSVANGWLRYDAILADIDHSPGSWLRPQHAQFYTDENLRLLAAHLRERGVFAMWSAVRPADTFLSPLRGVFGEVTLHKVPFFNPHVNEDDANWIVVAALERV